MVTFTVSVMVKILYGSLHQKRLEGILTMRHDQRHHKACEPSSRQRDIQ